MVKMDIDTDDELLQALADGKSMDYSQWPHLLSQLVASLEKIVTTEFPRPSFPNPPSTQSQPPSSLPESSESAPDPSVDPPTSNTADPSSQDGAASEDPTNKENNPPASQTTNIATTGGGSNTNSSSSAIPPGYLPPEIHQLLVSIIDTLQSLFSSYPPHTVQRLAELILNPRAHYRTLPAYLHALDRVVHVTSGANIFPLPPAIPDPASSASVLQNGPLSHADPLSISWGNPTSQQPSSTFGGDESLGGALLTPIPWLRNENGLDDQMGDLEAEVRTESTQTIDGPNGLGGIETVSVSVNGISSPREVSGDSAIGSAAGLRADGAVTQGELLRQEQRAGVVPAAQLAAQGADADGLGEEDEVPHARGPEEIGMEDMGPQSRSTSGPLAGMQGIDLEAAVGRRIEADPKEDQENEENEENEEMKIDVEKEAPKREAEEDLASEGKRLREDADSKEDDASNEEKAEAAENRALIDEDEKGHEAKAED